jgi:uncharacterized protein (DUF305 family)
MRTRQSRWTTAAFLTALASMACGTGATQEPQTGPRPDADESARLEALYQARMDSTTMTVSDADVAFMTGMISHHAQALIMSRMAPTHGASPEILILTSRIINAQTDEINVMQAWLRDRGRPVPKVDIEGTTLLIDGRPPMMMHGMLSPAQIAELDAARGADYDRTFLTYMIQHHEGAVHMVTELFATDGATQDDISFKVASDIQVDQITEIRRMKIMLEERAGGPPSQSPGH